MDTQQLQTLINKLESLKRSSNSPLNFDSSKVELKEQELKNLVKDPSISPIAYRTLSIYFQNTYLNKFSLEEWKLLLSFDYTHLENSNLEVATIYSFDLENPPVYINGSVINFSQSESNINFNHLKLLSINKSRSLTFLINYLLEQL